MGGGGVNGRGGASEVLPLPKGGSRNSSFSHAEAGGTQGFEVVLTWELEVLAILMGGTTSFHPLKGGGRKRFYPVLRGGAQTSFGPTVFPFCSPPSP